MRTNIFQTCLAVCVFSISLAAQDTSSSAAASSPQNTGAGPASTACELRGVDKDTNTPKTVPADPQVCGSGSGSSTTSSSGNVTGAGSSSAPASTSTTYVFPSTGQMNRYWLRTTLGPKAFVGAAFSGVWNTWVTNSPDEWGQGGSGWSKRFGSSLLDNGINSSSLVLGSRLVHQDPLYYRCECQGLKPRVWHAVRMTFMSHKMDGSLTVAPVKIISPFTGPMVTRNTIYPSSFGWGNAFSGGAYYLAGGVAWNLAREFISRRF